MAKKMEHKTLQEKFDHFLFCTIDGSPTENQRNFMRTAFFLGAATFLSGIMGENEDFKLPQEEQQELLEKTMLAFDAEILAFFADEKERMKQG